MPTCACCGTNYFAIGESWDSCGDCFAGALELMLGVGHADQRKPMMRASDGAARQIPSQRADAADDAGTRKAA